MKLFIFTFIIFQLGWWSCYLYEYLYEKIRQRLSHRKVR